MKDNPDAVLARQWRRATLRAMESEEFARRLEAVRFPDDVLGGHAQGGMPLDDLAPGERLLMRIARAWQRERMAAR